VVKPDLTKLMASANVSLDLQFKIHERELEAWEHYATSSRNAPALLNAAVEPWIWAELNEAQSSDSHQAYTAIQANNKPINDNYVHAKLDKINLRDPNSVPAMAQEFEQVYYDIGEVGGAMNRA
jgi:hypothetical protein